MARLAVCLEYYVHDRLNSNPGWQGIKVRGGARGWGMKGGGKGVGHGGSGQVKHS